MSRTLSEQYWLYAIAVGLLCSLPLFLMGLPFGYDLVHHYRVAQGLYDSIVSGNFYPSWLASTNGGYGDPSVRFYPPALYFLLAGLRAVTRDWYLASQLALTLLTVAGGVGMYLWARELTARSYAVAAALIYLLSPFHANEMYLAGMYAQYACASALPFVFAFIERILARNRWADAAGLAISYAMLILFNVPLALMGSIAAGIYALLRLAQSFKKEALYKLAAGALLGLALSCFYWLPVLFELKWKSPSGVGQGEWYDYRRNFIFRPSPNELHDWWMKKIIPLTLLLLIPAAVSLFKERRRALPVALVALLTFLMATVVSKPAWDIFPALQETQFPWRWLTITSACLSVLVALSLPELSRLRRTRLRPLALALLGLALIPLSFTVSQTIRGAVFHDRRAFDEILTLAREKETNRDFLPVWAASKPEEMNSPVEALGRKVNVTNWGAEQRDFQVETGNQVEARVKTFYYPLWKATAGGASLATRPASDGALLVAIPPDAVQVELKFIEPRSTYVAAVVSIIGLLLIALLVFLGRGGFAFDKSEARATQILNVNPES